MKRIKDVVQITGLSRRTLQYYDDRDLLQPVRSPENYRLYSDADLQKLWKILAYKEMSFTLDEIAIFLDKDEHYMSQVLEHKLAAIEQEMKNLQQTHHFVQHILHHGIPDQSIIQPTSKCLTYKDQIDYLAKQI